MTQADSTLVRIGRDLKFKLEQLGLSWQKLAQEGRLDVPHDPDRENLSIDRIVRELLRRDQEHRIRSKRSSTPRTAAEARPGPGGTEDGPGLSLSDSDGQC